MIDKILDIGNRWYHPNRKPKITKDEKEVITKAYRSETGENIGNCSACLIKMYLYFLTKSTKPMKTEQKFQMYKGKVLTQHGLSKPITRDNCSDDMALGILKRTPGAIKFFEKFPEDWKSQAEAYNPLDKVNGAATSKTTEAKTDAGKSSKEDEQKTKTDQYNLKKQNLEAKSQSELKDWAKSIGLPESQWKNKKKNGKPNGLVAYLMEATAE